MSADDARERALELLALRATDGLDGAQLEELDELLRQHPDAEDESLELAAAALALAAIRPLGPLPRALAERVRERVADCG